MPVLRSFAAAPDAAPEYVVQPRVEAPPAELPAELAALEARLQESAAELEALPTGVSDAVAGVLRETTATLREAMDRVRGLGPATAQVRRAVTTCRRWVDRPSRRHTVTKCVFWDHALSLV